MASITLDNKASGNAGAGGVSYSYTVGTNPNTVLLVGIWTNNLGSSPSGVAYGGVTMTPVVGNAGPISSFGFLGVYSLFNPPTGANNVTFSIGGSSGIFHTTYSYYNVGSIDSSAINQGNYASDFVTQSLTASHLNTLTWGVGGAHDVSFGGPFLNGPTNNPSTDISTEGIGAADFGINSSPVSNLAGMGASSGSGYATVALVALVGPQVYSITPVVGSYSLMGRSIILTLNHLYTLVATTGKYALTGLPVLLSYIPYKWKFVAKASNPNNWTDVPKATVPAQTMIQTVAGSPIGLLLALTYSTTSSIVSGGWTNVKKAVIPTSWTDINKPT